jgi:hypothetical protein
MQAEGGPIIEFDAAANGVQGGTAVITGQPIKVGRPEQAL